MTTVGQGAPTTVVEPSARTGLRLAWLGAVLLLATVVVGVGERTNFPAGP